MTESNSKFSLLGPVLNKKWANVALFWGGEGALEGSRVLKLVEGEGDLLETCGDPVDPFWGCDCGRRVCSFYSGICCFNSPVNKSDAAERGALGPASGCSPRPIPCEAFGTSWGPWVPQKIWALGLVEGLWTFMKRPWLKSSFSERNLMAAVFSRVSLQASLWGKFIMSNQF